MVRLWRLFYLHWLYFIIYFVKLSLHKYNLCHCNTYFHILFKVWIISRSLITSNEPPICKSRRKKLLNPSVLWPNIFCTPGNNAQNKNFCFVGFNCAPVSCSCYCVLLQHRYGWSCENSIVVIVTRVALSNSLHTGGVRNGCTLH